MGPAACAAQRKYRERYLTLALHWEFRLSGKGVCFRRNCRPLKLHALMNVDQQCKLFGLTPPDLLPNLTVATGSLHWWTFPCARKSVLGDVYQHSRHVEQPLDFCTFHSTKPLNVPF